MTDATISPDAQTARAKRNVIVLVLAQATIGAQMPMIFTVGGLAGQSLATNPCLATLPISLIVLGSMIAATPLSAFMQRFGRRAGFFVGATGGAAGGAVGALGLHLGSFPILLVGALLTGIYMSAHQFYRFAATDTAPKEYEARAISYVMAGGLISAVVGPQLATLTSQSMVIPFLGTYMAVVVVNLLGASVFFFLDIPKVPPLAAGEDGGRTRWQMLKTPRIAVAMICGTISYGLMSLMMTSTPLAVVGCGFQESDAGNIVSAHVLAMFAPSFFTGYLINRFGVERIMGLGLAILLCAGMVALAGVDLLNFFGALVLLGIGWNFGFIGATAMLTASHTKAERGRIQGLNDLILFGGVTLASLSSGGLMNCSGGTAVEGWNAVTMAMVPPLVLAGAALLWLVLRPEARTPS
ncbi:MFS transporter [Chachezhania antarctica]|uniref:MFS transporter n=1 Tax=Chachezhania antarctica TaxID=2340860 RepID=UPI000EB4FE4B|nr:MFS transporter [Chachezhania antarctica]